MIMSAAVKEDATRLCRIPQLFFSTRCNIAPPRTNPQTNLENPKRAGYKSNKQTLGSGKKEFYRGQDWDVSVPNFYYIIELVDKSIIWGGNYFADKLKVTRTF